MAVGRKLPYIMHQMWIDKTDFIYGEYREKNYRKLYKHLKINYLLFINLIEII